MMRYWYEGFIGLRYLRASPKRGSLSLIAGIAILGLALGVAGPGTVSGLEGRITNWRADLEKLERFPGVVGAAPYIEQQGMLIHGDKSSGVLLRGILPEAERRVVDLAPHLLRGSLSDLTGGKYRVILGSALAEELGAKVGDRVVLLVALGDVTPVGVIPRMRAFEVTGILSIGMSE